MHPVLPIRDLSTIPERHWSAHNAYKAGAHGSRVRTKQRRARIVTAGRRGETHVAIAVQVILDAGLQRNSTPSKGAPLMTSDMTAGQTTSPAGLTTLRVPVASWWRSPLVGFFQQATVVLGGVMRRHSSGPAAFGTEYPLLSSKWPHE